MSVTDSKQTTSRGLNQLNIFVYFLSSFQFVYIDIKTLTVALRIGLSLKQLVGVLNVSFNDFIGFLRNYFYARRIESILALAKCYLPRSAPHSLRVLYSLVYECYTIFTSTTTSSATA